MWFYTSCSYCTAKWFAPFCPKRCPRCGAMTLRSEPLMPPWLREEDEDAGGGSEAREAESGGVEAGAESEVSDQEENAKRC